MEKSQESRKNQEDVENVERYYTVDIIIVDRENAYSNVNELLHVYSNVIKLRVGYPVPDENIAVIFLVVKTTNDIFGAFTGKLGKINGVKVKSIAVK
ncbi:MAG TPA: iron-only hydrogenase system regulator [Fervidobacterium sp.]|nr:iron-only hydrogenase system regulator [Fervidobacterium sp.]HPT54162.1 iron-only hydrogenase system regulator [Fervidobacterium sp.]HPZ17465.1 iron-only hydrogenase system regulator [Fervidobacterium sp.]HQE48532.1 iron-only hydrogenase system regulator [Fervidobacterium sp.]HUM42329.1 iron-only hydrogenase system regulator [Fervidobacterium sp.]